MNPWIWIVIGGVFEAMWAVTLNLSDGFAVLSWAAVTIAITLVSVWFLNRGLAEGVPVGAGYAVWTGCGTVFSVAAGLMMGQTMRPEGWLFLLVILAGVLLMQMADRKAQ